MKRKGFTLIEMMAVIIVIALLSMAVVPSILKQVSKQKDNTKEKVKNLIIDAAEQYRQDHIVNIGTTDKCINIKFLIDEDYLAEDNKFNDYGYNMNNTYILIDSTNNISADNFYSDETCSNKL